MYPMWALVRSQTVRPITTDCLCVGIRPHWVIGVVRGGHGRSVNSEIYQRMPMRREISRRSRWGSPLSMFAPRVSGHGQCYSPRVPVHSPVDFKLPAEPNDRELSVMLDCPPNPAVNLPGPVPARKCHRSPGRDPWPRRVPLLEGPGGSAARSWLGTAIPGPCSGPSGSMLVESETCVVRLDPKRFGPITY